MQQKTLIILVALAVIVIAAVFTLRMPEKGQRTGVHQRPVAAIKSTDIKELDLSTEKGNVILRLDAATWKITAPGTWKADQNLVKGVLDQLAKLGFGDQVTTKAERFTELEVAGDKAIHVVAKDASGKAIIDGWIGKAVAGYTMFRPAAKEEVWQATGMQKYSFIHDVKAWRDHTILEFVKNDVSRLAVEAQGQKILLEAIPPAEKSGTVKWKVIESSIKVDPFDDATANNLVQTLTTLRAASFADEVKPVDAGLDPPQLAITLTVKGETKKLLLGKVQGEEAWVQVSGQPQIFTLQKYAYDQIEQPPINFRDKTIVKAPAADLTSIEVNYGGAVLTLHHDGDAWKPAQGGDFDEAKVRSLVTAFENLQGSGFAPSITPKAAGLDKPTSTITLRMRDKGQVVLKVGALKGNDAYYLQKTGTSDVMVVRKWTVERFLKKLDDLKKSAKP